MAKRPITVYARVRSADGTEYTVSSINGDLAWLYPIDERGGGVELPLSELTRITDPAKRNVPIEGMATDRPLCAMCGAKLAPMTNMVYEGERRNRRLVRKTFVRWQGYPRHNPIFHSQTCATRFAVLAHQAGYRITKKGST